MNATKRVERDRVEAGTWDHAGRRSHRCRWAWWVATLPLAWAWPLHADDPTEDVRQVEAADASDTLAIEDDLLADDALALMDIDMPMVITATRREQKLNSVPHAMSVITAEDIRRSGAQTIGDALRLVPGVDVADLTFGNDAVSPRGLHGIVARQVLVLVDGRQIFDSVFGGTTWGAWPFQIDEVERIEVIRGPGGVTWGANAMNGVINIITKGPAEEPATRIGLGAGSRGWVRGNVSRDVHDDPLSLRWAVEHELSEGYARGGSILRRFDEDYRASRFSVKGEYAREDGHPLRFAAGAAVASDLYPASPLGGIGASRHDESRSAYVMFQWGTRTAAKAAREWTFYINDYHLAAGLKQVDYSYQQIALQFSEVTEPEENRTLTWGIDGRVDLLDTSNSEPFLTRRDHLETVVLGVYLQDSRGLSDKWTVDGGVRVDYDAYGGFEPSARLSATRDLDDGAVAYAAVSRAFQMAPVGLRFLRLPLLNGISVVHGQQDMDAQSLLAYEVGYRGKLFKAVETGLNLYWHEYDDLTPLAFRLGPPGLLRIDLDNRGPASLYGLELDMRYPVDKKLTLLANYTFQELSWRASAPLHQHDNISPPRHKAMLGARYSPDEDLHLSGHMYYVDAVKAPNPAWPFGTRRVDPYVRLDLLAMWEMDEDRASISLGVKNLLDSHHYEGGTWFINDAEVPRVFFVEYRRTLK